MPTDKAKNYKLRTYSHLLDTVFAVVVAPDGESAVTEQNVQAIIDAFANVKVCIFTACFTRSDITINVMLLSAWMTNIIASCVCGLINSRLYPSIPQIFQ